MTHREELRGRLFAVDHVLLGHGFVLGVRHSEVVTVALRGVETVGCHDERVTSTPDTGLFLLTILILLNCDLSRKMVRIYGSVGERGEKVEGVYW